MSRSPQKMLILGAHPDDAEFHAGGLSTMYAQQGHQVKMVSVTNGGAGHHRLDAEELVQTRREEARRAGEVIGFVYETWEFPDGALQPTLELRQRIIREIRMYAPDLVLTHRTSDYHPDHRAVGQAVQDASYLVTVPLVVPEVPIVENEPLVAYMVDLFTKPCPLEPHVVIDIEPQMAEIISMLACHRSQVFDFLPFNQGILDQVPKGETERKEWLLHWFTSLIEPRADRFRTQLVERYGQEQGSQARWIEAYEVSEYAGQATPEKIRDLFLI